jgi:hypothetical protein
MVYVSIAGTDWDAVNDFPAIAKLPQLPTNLFLAFCAATPSAFLAVLVKHSQYENPERVGVLHLAGPHAQRGTRPI